MTGKRNKDTVRRPIIVATAIGIRLVGLGALSYVAFSCARWAISQPDLSVFSAAVVVGSLAALALALSSTRYLLQRGSASPHGHSFRWIDARTVSIARHLAEAGARPIGQR